MFISRIELRIVLRDTDFFVFLHFLADASLTHTHARFAGELET